MTAVNERRVFTPPGRSVELTGVVLNTFVNFRFQYVTLLTDSGLKWTVPAKCVLGLSEGQLTHYAAKTVAHAKESIMTVQVGLVTKIKIPNTEPFKRALKNFFHAFPKEGYTYRIVHEDAFTVIYLDGHYGQEVSEWLRSMKL